MDTATFLGIAAFLGVLLTIVNLYNLTIRKPQEIHEGNLKETDKALTDFITQYSSEYGGLKQRVTKVEEEILELKHKSETYVTDITKLDTLVDVFKKHVEGGE